MKFQLPTIQIAIVGGIVVTAISHLGELIFWSVLVGLAVALLRYGLSGLDEFNAEKKASTFQNYFPEEEEQELSELTLVTEEHPSSVAEQLSELLQEDLWQEVKAMDEQVLGTTPKAQADAVDADIVEPMPDSMPVAKKKAAARWGYRGKNIQPPTASNDNLEVNLIATRLKLVLPKETGKARKTWGQLCKQLNLSGYTSKKDAKPSIKALWLSQKGVSFEQIVKASLTLAA